MYIEETEREVHRGDIYYVSTTYVTGSEQQGGRPAIVVSNEQCNKFSPTVSVVYLTSREKTDLPTHIDFSDSNCSVYGTILCETISTISKARLGTYVDKVSNDIMQKIDDALRIQLALTTNNDVSDLRSQLMHTTEVLKCALEREALLKSMYIKAIKGEA
jgi:mRNA interferase MazF